MIFQLSMNFTGFYVNFRLIFMPGLTAKVHVTSPSFSFGILSLLFLWCLRILRALKVVMDFPPLYHISFSPEYLLKKKSLKSDLSDTTLKLFFLKSTCLNRTIPLWLLAFQLFCGTFLGVLNTINVMFLHFYTRLLDNLSWQD